MAKKYITECKQDYTTYITFDSAVLSDNKLHTLEGSEYKVPLHRKAGERFQHKTLKAARAFIASYPAGIIELTTI